MLRAGLLWIGLLTGCAESCALLSAPPADETYQAEGVQRIGERYPIHARYAGQEFPLEEIDPALARKYAGFRFSPRGFPEFTPWVYEERGVRADLRIPYQGDRSDDFRLCNDMMRDKLRKSRWKQPRGYTWHHHEDVGRMQLIPSDLHNQVKHTGGVAVFKAGGGLGYDEGD